MYLGLDFALTTGWAVLDDEESLVGYGAFSSRGPLEGKKLEDRAFREGQRYQLFYKSLEELIVRYEPDAMFYEQSWSHSSTNAWHLAGAWLALSQLLAFRRGVPMFPVTWSQVKAAATGGSTPASVQNAAKKNRRKEWKKFMVHQAIHAWEIEDPDGLTDDMADAMWVASAGMEIYEDELL